MSLSKGCEATVRGSEYHCNKCGLVWDLNDDDPPSCQTDDPLVARLTEISTKIFANKTAFIDRFNGGRGRLDSFYFSDVFCLFHVDLTVTIEEQVRPTADVLRWVNALD